MNDIADYVETPSSKGDMQEQNVLQTDQDKSGQTKRLKNAQVLCYVC